MLVISLFAKIYFVYLKCRIRESGWERIQRERFCLYESEIVIHSPDGCNSLAEARSQEWIEGPGNLEKVVNR